MENQIEQIITPTLSEIAAQAAQAMKDAATQYGPDAVDLGLLVVRLDAAGTLASALLWTLGAGALTVWLVRKALTLYRAGKDEGHYDDGAVMASGFVAAVAVLPAGLTLLAASELLDIFRWAAVFGYPEAMIAANALRAVGLL